MMGNRTALTLFVSIFLIIPLGTLPSVSMLKYSSFLTVISMFFMTFVVILRCAQKVGIKSGTIADPTPQLWNWSWEAFKAAPVIWYNSGFIFQAIPVLAPYPKQFTRPRMIAVMATVTFIVSALMISLGIPGYLTFFKQSNGNILTNYAIDDTLVGICRALVTVVVVCSYPLFNMPLRDSLFYLLRHLHDWTTGKITHTAEDDAAFAAAEADSPSSTTSSTPTTTATAPSPSSSHESTQESYSTNSEEHGEEMVTLDFDGSTATKSPTPTSSPGSPISPQPNNTMRTTTTNFQNNKTTRGDTEEAERAHKTHIYWMKCFIQTFVCWLAAFAIAYVIPDITVIIGFVASTFSPLYYFALPACVALTLPERTTSTKIGGYFLLCVCAYFIISGLGTYLLPKNVMYHALPSHSHTNATAALVCPLV